MRPSSNLQYEVYPALVVWPIYVIVGAWGQARYFWIGAAVFVLSLLGVFFLKPSLSYWLALVGGGGRVAGGFRLRRA